MTNEKISARKILATFNKSKSGQSLIKIKGTTMYIVNGNVVELIKNKEIDEVEFIPGSDMMDRDDPSKVAYKTMQVDDYTETKLAKIREANLFTEEMRKFDKEAYGKAVKDAEGLVL